MTLAVTAVPAPAFAPVRSADAAMPRTQADAVPIAPCLDTDEVPLGGAYDVYYIHTDHRGAPVFMTDESADVVWTTEYDPFGNALCDWGRVHQDATGRSECVPNDWVSGERVVMNLRLPGQYYDEESGLHYNWHRYYDPKIGRYLTPDGRNVHADSRNAGFNKSYPGKRLNRNGVQLGWDDFAVNPYVYTDGNPLVRIDPYGLWYVDFNTTVGIGLGLTYGIVIGNTGIYLYGGKAITTPTVGGAVTFSLQDASSGWFRGLQASSIAKGWLIGPTFQFGDEAGLTWNPFAEGGIAFGSSCFSGIWPFEVGLSLSRFLVFPITEWKDWN